MTEEILKRLDLLATKLQVTVEHLWEVLVKQAILVRYIDGLYIFVSIISFIWALQFIKSGLILEKNRWDEPSGLCVFRCVVGFVIIIAALYITGGLSQELITSIWNPEYLALTTLGSLFK